MPKIKLGEFLPDQERINNPGLISVVNAKPVIDGYLPVKDSVNISTNAMTGKGRFIRTFTASSGTVFTFGGDATKLYQLDAALALNDVSHAAGAYTSGDWRVAVFGDRVLAVNGATGDATQSFIMGTDTIFLDLALVPKAGSISIVKNVFTFMGNITEDATSPEDPGVHVPHRIRWSAANDPSLFYPAPAVLAASLSGFQDLNDAGEIRNITGGAQPVILAEKHIYRATFEGGQTIFRFDRVQEDHGCLAGNTVVSFLGSVYYLSQDGWFKMGSDNSLTGIGNGKIDRFFFADIDNLNLNRISAFINADQQLIMWAYPGAGSSVGDPNRVLVYNYAVEKWAILEIAIDCLGTISTSGFTLEQLDQFGDLDGGLAGPMDDDFYKGEKIGNGSVVGGFAAHFGGGPTLTAQFITGDLELSDTNLTYIKSIFPIVDAVASDITVQTGVIDTVQENPLLGAEASIGKFGDIPTNSRGRYHRIRLNVGGDWVSAKALDLKVSKLGTR